MRKLRREIMRIYWSGDVADMNEARASVDRRTTRHAAHTVRVVAAESGHAD
jgi:hypothetical protein